MELSKKIRNSNTFLSIVSALLLMWALTACTGQLSGNIVSSTSKTEKVTLAAAPVISSISPTSGTISGGTLISISGSGFDTSDSILIGGLACPLASVPTSTTLSCITAAHSWGSANIVIQNGNSQSASLVNAFTFIAPSPTLSTPPVAPNSGSIAGSTSVTIRGTGFLSGATATIGSLPCTSPVVNTTANPNTITCNTSAHPAATVPVIVNNPDSSSATATSAYTFTGTAGAPTALTYSTNPAWYSNGFSITSNVPANTGGTVTSYSVVPSLPAGLTLNTTTGVISGTPTASTPSATYVVTASNSSGSTSANLILGVTDFGDGSSGALAISSSGTVLNNYTYVTDSSVPSASTGFNVADASHFSIGNLILIIQMQHSSVTSVYWELAHIQYIYPPSGTTTYILLSGPLAQSYTSGTFNSAASEVTQVVQVPQFTDLTIPLGMSITAPNWESATGKHYGGVIAFEASGKLTVNGSINASGIGFRGGSAVANSGGAATSFQGESWNGIGTAATAENNGAGGGTSITAGNAQSGGGGAYATVGGSGTSSYAGTPGAGGSSTFGIANLTRMFLGPGGGGSTLTNGCSTTPPIGAAGGGIILIFANTLNISGTGAIAANGANAMIDPSSCAGDVGGAGAGGSIYLKSAVMTLGAGQVTALGGSAQTSISGPSSGTGGSGGNGRVRLDYNSITGSSNPAVGFTGTP